MTQTMQLIPKETQQFCSAVDLEADKFEAAPVTTDLELAAAADALKIIKKRLDEMGDKRMAITRPLDESKKTVIELFRPFIEKLERAKRSLEGRMVTYQKQQEIERARQQAELDRIAKEKEERLKNELADKAVNAIEEGKPELANIYLDKAEKVTVKPTNAVAFSRPTGTAFVERWKFKVVDASKLPREFLKPDEDKIGKVVTALKNKQAAESTIPGIEAFTETGVSSRR